MVRRHKNKIRVGDIYLDCDNHPVFCTESLGDDVAGISLIDASRPRSCSIMHCAVTKLKPRKAAEIREVWDLVLPTKLRDVYYHSDKRLEIINFAHDCETSVSSGVVDKRGAFESIGQIDDNISMWADAQGYGFDRRDIFVISGLVLLNLYLKGWLSKDTVKLYFARDINKLAV